MIAAITKIKKWIFKIKIGSPLHNKLKAHITNFYSYHFEPYFSYHNFKITKLKFYNFPSCLTIEIHSLSPGIIIGPRGEHIDALTDRLKDKFDKPVKIQLEETNPFK
jgi:ribosomal protein S3